MGQDIHRDIGFQAFVRLTHRATGQEIVFVAEPDDVTKQYKFELVSFLFSLSLSLARRLQSVTASQLHTPLCLSVGCGS